MIRVLYFFSPGCVLCCSYRSSISSSRGIATVWAFDSSAFLIFELWSVCSWIMWIIQLLNSDVMNIVTIHYQWSCRSGRTVCIRVRNSAGILIYFSLKMHKEGSNAYLTDALSITIHRWRCAEKSEDAYWNHNKHASRAPEVQDSINSTSQNVHISFTPDYDQYSYRKESTVGLNNAFRACGSNLFIHQHQIKYL